MGGCGSAPGGTRSCSSAGSGLKQTPEVQPEPSVRLQESICWEKDAWGSCLVGDGWQNHIVSG